MKKQWNRCDICGQFIALDDFEAGRAIRRELTPDSEYSRETWETEHVLCAQKVGAQLVKLDQAHTPA